MGERFTKSLMKYRYNDRDINFKSMALHINAGRPRFKKSLALIVSLET